MTRVVHASVLIQFGGCSILTDPWFSERPGYYHGEPLGLGIEELPQLAAVVCSHSEYAHFDLEGFAGYRDHGVPMIVNRGSGKRAREAGFGNVIELDPWQAARLGPLRVTAAPARHGVTQNSYIIECGGRKVLFGSDSALGADSGEVARRFPDLDLALLPINGVRIRLLFNQQVVMNARQAATLARILRPRIAVPTHYRYTAGRFRDRFLLKYTGTPEAFAVAMAELAPDTLVRVLETGQALVVD